MNKRELEILRTLQRELGIRKSEHASVYGAWWILTELLHGRLGAAERMSKSFLNLTEERTRET